MILNSGILIGFGRAGTELAQVTLEHCVRKNPETKPFIRNFSVVAEGTPAPIGETGFGTEGAVEIGRVTGAGVDGEAGYEGQPWVEARALMVASLDAFEAKFRSAFEGVRHLKVQQHGGAGSEPLMSSGSVEIVLLIELSDPIAAAMGPVVERLEQTLRVHYAVVPRRVHLVLLSPDLDGTAEPIRHARSYACLHELEKLFEVEAMRRCITFAWLFGRQNEAGFFLTSFESLAPIIAAFMAGQVTRKLLTDESFGFVLDYRVHDRKCFYNSIGYSRLVYPRERLLQAICDRLERRHWESHPAFQSGAHPAPAVLAQSQAFLVEQNYADVAQLIQRTADGDPIFRAPTLPALREEGGVESQLAHAETWVTELVVKEASAVEGRLARRREELAKTLKAAIAQWIGAKIDSNETATTALVIGWLASLQGEPSPFVEGDVESFPITMSALEGDIRSYFDPHFEEFLFGDNRAPGLAAYLEENHLAGGGRRAERERLERNLESKQRQEQLLAGQLPVMELELLGLEAQLEADTQLEEDATPPVEAASSKAAVVTSDSAEEIESDDDASTLEEVGDSEKVIESDVEAPKPAPISPFAALVDHKKEEVRVARESLATYHTEIRQLEGYISTLRQEIGQLDRAISDASQRRSLLASRIAEHRAEVVGAEEKFRLAAAAHDKASSELEAYAATRGSSAGKSFSGGAVVLLAGGIAGAMLHPAFALGGAFLAAVFGWRLFAHLFVRGDDERKLLCANLRAQMKQAYSGLLELQAQHVRIRYDHARHGEMVTLQANLDRHIAALKGRIERGWRFLQDDLWSGTDHLSEHEFDSDLPYQEFIIPGSSVGAVIAEREAELKHALAQFEEQHPLSELLEHLQEKSWDTALVEPYRQKLRKKLFGVYKHLDAYDIEEVVEERLPEASALDQLAERMLARATPFAAEGRFHASESSPQSLFFAGLPTPGQSSRLAKAVQSASTGASREFKGDANTEVELFRFSIGRPLFDLSICSEAHFYFASLDDDQRAELFCDDGPYVEPVPSALVFGDHQSKGRKAATLAIAYGLAELQRMNGQAEVAYSSAQHRFRAGWIQFFEESSAGMSIVFQDVEARRKARSSADLARLEQAAALDWPDEVERRILIDEIEHYTEI